MNTTEMSILVLGTEEYTGVWDAALEVRDSLPVPTRYGAAVELTASLLQRLIMRGLIEIYDSEPQSSDPQFRRIEDWEAVLADPRTWVIPIHGETGKRRIYFLATLEGDRVAKLAHYGQTAG